VGWELLRCGWWPRRRGTSSSAPEASYPACREPCGKTSTSKWSSFRPDADSRTSVVRSTRSRSSRFLSSSHIGASARTFADMTRTALIATPTISRCEPGRAPS